MDRYLEFTRSPLGRRLVSALGWPAPPRLRRAQGPVSKLPLKDRAVLIGGAADAAPAAQWLLALMAAVGDLQAVYDFFHGRLARLPAGARCVLVTQAPSSSADWSAAAVQSALRGFVRSLAKEIGRAGATVNLIEASGSGQDDLAGPLRFLLSDHCAFVSGQVIGVGPAAPGTGPTHRFALPLADNAGQAHDATSQSGVVGWGEAAAVPMAARGLAINAVAPGFIETAITAALPSLPREISRRLSSLGQAGLAQDVAEAALFLASPAAAGINGRTLRVCGQNWVGA
jgi:NAD(P)-dependent dehydrogenase (short-subunit alcohol dehydrogenase family)